MTRPRALILGALSLLAMSGSAAVAETSWRELLNRAEQLSAEGKSAEAAQAARAALADADKSLDPESSDIAHILALLNEFYNAAGEDSQLPEMERRLSALKSKNFEAWFALGTVLHKEEKILEAEGAIKKAIALKPADTGAEFELLTIYDDMGRLDDSIPLLKKMIVGNPDQLELYLQLARTYMRLGRSAEAQEAYVQAKKMNGGTAHAYIEEGYFYSGSGKNVEAEKDFKNAVDVDTESPAGYHHLGAFLSRNGQYPEAEKYLRRALERLEANPNTKRDDLIHTIDWLSDTLLAQGRVVEAEALLRKCLEKPEPTVLVMDCMLSLGRVYASLGKNELAESTLKQAASVCESGPACLCRGRALVGLANFYLKQGRRAEALAQTDESARVCVEHDGVIRADNFMQLAELYGKLSAEEWSGRGMAESASINLDSTLPRMADSEMRRGLFNEAEALYRQGVGIFKALGDRQREAAMFDGLAAACEKEGKHQEAIAARENSKLLKDRPR